MKRVVKVAISLPEELLGRVDAERRRHGETRSQYFRDAAATRLGASRIDTTAAYRQGYRDQPETEDEVTAAAQSALAILAAEPWD